MINVLFMLAMVFGGILTFSENNDGVFRATIEAKTFFIFMIPLVLLTIVNTNLSNFKVGS
ncbi:MAG: hypothetical protein ACJA0T_000236 [Colwellia sp.]|jgi:hypothetical protein